MAPADDKPTGAETKHGVTCTSRHEPHEESAQGSVLERGHRDPTAHGHARDNAPRRVPPGGTRVDGREGRQVPFTIP